jgi:hypothetical protein
VRDVGVEQQIVDSLGMLDEDLPPELPVQSRVALEKRYLPRR